MRFADFGRETVVGERALDARNQVVAIGVVIRMLQLAAPAFGEVPARRLQVMPPKGQRTVVEHSVARNPEWNVPAA